jgi:hypothetical protein
MSRGGKSAVHRRVQAFLGAALLVGAVGARAADLDVRAIMDRNYVVARLKGMRTDSTMVLITDKGQTRERKFTSVSALRENGVDSNVLMTFSTPADVKGTSFLEIEHSDGDDDIWIYLPALKKTRRLVANNKKDSFLGSDFAYADLLTPRPDTYRYTLLRSEAAEGSDCYVVESVPRDDTVKKEQGYGKKVLWIRKDNFLEVKVEYYDTSGALLKTQTTAQHKLMDPASARWVPLQRRMVNHQTGHITEIRLGKAEPDFKIPDSYFSVRNIERERE